MSKKAKTPAKEFPWTGKEIVARIGCKGTYTPKQGAFPIAIEVRSARYTYGRNELLVTNGGMLFKWVRSTSVKLQPKEKVIHEGSD